MQALRSVLVLGFLAICVTFQSAQASSEIQNVLPSFTVDATEGVQASGFVVHFTNTSINVDETCGLPVSYAWTIDNGAMGVDWILVEGTTETTTDLAVEFITQGCYNVQVEVSGLHSFVECVLFKELCFYRYAYQRKVRSDTFLQGYQFGIACHDNELQSFLRTSLCVVYVRTIQL